MPRLLAATALLFSLGLGACANDGPKSAASQPRPGASGAMVNRTASNMPPQTTRTVMPDGRVVETTTSSTFSAENTLNGVPVDPAQLAQGRVPQLPTFSSLTIVDPNNPPPRARLSQPNLPPGGPDAATVTHSTTKVTEEAAIRPDAPPPTMPMSGYTN